jgi:diacylglycerol kinase (ATP)
MRTLIIINANAAGGKAVAVFKSIEGRAADVFGDFTVAVTEKPEELAGHLDASTAAGVERLIAVGGDGTNHSVVNALAERPGPAPIFGCLPVGTGSDWARALGMPSNPAAALDWLAEAQPLACDLGKVEYLDMRRGARPAKRYFLNIASAGVSGEVDARVNRAQRRTAATFLMATIATLLKYKPQWITVDCDGHKLYEGRSYLLAVANGQFFGRGMWVAPNALINDGVFDVVLVEGMPRRRILLALGTVFSGKHLRRKDVHSTRAASVRVHSEGGPLGLDFDGEEAQGQDLLFTILPGAVKILVHPSAPSIWLKKHF